MFQVWIKTSATHVICTTHGKHPSIDKYIFWHYLAENGMESMEYSSLNVLKS